MSNPPPTPDPYASYLQQADGLFARGEVVKAGQIWQAILKQQPDHAEARARLLVVKQRLLAQREAEAARPAPEPPPPAPAVPPAPPSGSEPERLVLEGCTLYDMGQVEDALRKWEEVLALVPDHALARSYAEGARRELGFSPLAPPPPAPPAPEPQAAGGEDADKLLREAVQLYDMGLAEEAISKWERVLVLEPHRSEVQEYLRQAREEVTQAALATAPTPILPPAPPVAPAEPEGLDLKLRQADHLLSLQRHEEAAFTYQQALRLAPGHPRALEGLERCRRTPPPPAPPAPVPPRTPAIPMDAQGRIAVVDEEATLILEPQAVAPPATLLRAAPAPREGLALPERLQAASARLPWLRNPRILAGLGGGLILLLAGFAGLQSYRKDRALKEAVKSARAAALAPVLQQAQAPDLTESPAAIREEAEAALEKDPLRAYLRAQTLVAQHPGEAEGPQLLEKARAGLAGGVTGASLAEFQKHLQNGDLEAAARVMDALLRAQPDEADLRARAARLHLALCAAHAGQAKWDEAAEDLRRGRALFPGDKTWQARLRLLERVKALPKAQQASWIPLLG